jgi:hypothetical protein
VWQDSDRARLDFETKIDTAVLGGGAFNVTRDSHPHRVVVSPPRRPGHLAWWADDEPRLRRADARYQLPIDEAVARFGIAPKRTTGRTPSNVEVVEVWTAATFEC